MAIHERGFEDEEEGGGERRKKKRIEREKYQKGMNIHEAVCAHERTVIESEKCYREWESRGATLKLSVLIFPLHGY